MYRAENPDGSWQHTQALELQRVQLYTLQRIAFFTGKRAGYRVKEPEPYYFPWEEDPDASIKGDAMTMEDADDWLGWTDEMKAHLERVAPDLTEDD